MSALAHAAGLVTPEELATKENWINATLETPGPAALPPGLNVIANHDSVSKNARGKGPLTIVDKQYTRGLFCHAVSKIAVQLPGPGKTFSAIVGVDSNEQTKPGRGSVVFSVSAARKELFKSPVMREGMAGVPVNVDLNGATSVMLDVSDAGDGISCDQSDWAEAKFSLVDGKEVWLADLPLVETTPGGLPFSFTYGGKSSAELLSQWERKAESKKLDENRTQRTISWTDAQTGLLVRCVAIEYLDFPTVEWTLYFKNAGQADTPILENILALDVGLSGKKNTILHHHAGSQATPEDYRPLQTQLQPNTNTRFASSGGRGSDGVWPYFNIDWGNKGVIAVVGWPGQWTGSFKRDAASGLQIRAGQEQCHFKLLPGEEVRSPLIVLQFWEGNAEAGTAGWIKAQNVWRRWMLAYNLPRLSGKLPPPLFPCGSSNQMNEMQNATEENQKQFIDGYVQNGVQLSFWWMDAGWYTFKEGWWNVGTWEVDKKRFPNGLRAVSDHAHKLGVKTLLWWEPERVTPGTRLYEEHPDWLLGKNGEQKLLDLGNKQAREWITDYIDKFMQAEGIDIYRQDFNFAPLGYWRGKDAPDRQGIAEIQHVTGYLAFWDELRRRHPDLLIDTCASGGRRNDLETLRRSVPLHKSDMEYSNLTSKQTQLYGLAFWEPYFGAPIYPADRVDVYGFRSGFAPMTGAGYDTRRKNLDYPLMKKLFLEWKDLAPNFFGDFYPLTSWSFESDVWMAWQFDRPEGGAGVPAGGMVEAFRRPQSLYEAARFKLRGLKPDARYSLKNLDIEEETEALGSELMEKGLLINIGTQPGAVIIKYEQK
ncbi:MAG TPA: alpha-galactosidase [Planctomycetota bacterium]|jgi:alpha-galactosidase